MLENTNVDDYITDIEPNILSIGPVKGFKRYDLNVYEGYPTLNSHQRTTYPFWRGGQTRVNSLTHYNTPEFGDEYDDSYYFNLLQYTNANFSERALFNGSFPSVDFDKTTEIRAGHSENYNFNPGDNFTVSFWANISQSAEETSYLISKSTTKTIIPSDQNPIGLAKTPTTTGSHQIKDVPAGAQYPFEIYATSNKIYFSRTDGDITTTINGTFTLGSMTHFTCRVKDGTMAIFKNAVSLATGADKTIKQTQNKANLYIGNKGGKTNKLSGSMSQINIYNVALTDTQVLNNYSSSNGSPYIGNVFYQTGISTITHPGYLNALNSNVTDDEGEMYQYKFQGSHLIYENEYQCTVEEHEFNDTLNTTARKRISSQEQELAGFVTSSNFKPYVTTIGLYNENNDLLVVGKLGQPIRTSNETDTTFVVRWDT